LLFYVIESFLITFRNQCTFFMRQVFLS
jgi:hypothetical protein